MTDQLTQLTILRSSDAAKLKLHVVLATTTLAELKHCILEQFKYYTHGCDKDQLLPTTTKSKQSKKKKKPTHPLQPPEQPSSSSSSPPVQLRIFHLGRELKSGGRSLDKLGVGRFRNNTILHVHVVPPLQPPQMLLSSRTSTTHTTANTIGMPFNPMMTAPAIPPHPLLPAPWPGTSSPVAMADPTTTTIRITTTATGKQVIELLDDSDDDNDHADNDDGDDNDHGHSTNQDDDDTSSVIEVSSPPPKKRQRV